MEVNQKKENLIANANDHLDQLFNKLTAFNDVAESEFEFKPENMGEEAHWKRDKNMRDVLMHLYEWNRLFALWISANRNGESRPLMPAPYDWSNYDGFNMEIFNKYQDVEYHKACELLKESNNELLALIDTLTTDELFVDDYFAWNENGALGYICASTTADHYDWAMDKLEKHISTFGKN